MKKLLNAVGLWLLMMTALTCVTAYINGTFNLSEADGMTKFMYGMLSALSGVLAWAFIYDPAKK